MAKFSETLEEWYASYGRHDLPWRQTRDPYRIWISEIILQQTRIAQGYDYYLRFLARFPDVSTLADAPEDEVLKLWQGLGYYSRARNLHAAAKCIASRGKFPDRYEEVRALKGVGDYTAAAICSFSYQQPYPVVDGNVYRVLSRIFGIQTPIDSTLGKKEFHALARQLLDSGHPDIYNSAIMDFGATQCTPQSPDCSVCPFSSDCQALKEHRVSELPVKAKKTAVTERFLVYVLMEDSSRLLLRRRPAGDIWQGLYEPFLLEFEQKPQREEVLSALAEKTAACGHVLVLKKGIKHQLTHRRLWIDCYQMSFSELPQIDGYFPVPKNELMKYAASKVVSELFTYYLCSNEKP